MTQQPTSPPDLAPTVPDHLTPHQLIALWVDLYDASEAFLLAGLRREVGPDGDVMAAYCQWYQEQLAEHDQAVRQMFENFYQRGVRHGH